VGIRATRALLLICCAFVVEVSDVGDPLSYDVHMVDCQ